MIEYLNNGGNLYIESVNIGADHHTTTFFDYLGINYLLNSSGQEAFALSGLDGESFVNNRNYFCYGGYSPHYQIDRLTSNGAEALFESEDSYKRMFLYENNDYKVISSSVILATFVSGDTLNLRPYLAAEMVNYFLDFNPNVGLSENDISTLSNSSYPNPFVNETRINFSIAQSGNVVVNIYNVAGQLVKQLVNGERSKGDYSVRWDATNDNGQKVKAGLYFYKISTSQMTQSEKMVLVR